MNPAQSSLWLNFPSWRHCPCLWQNLRGHGSKLTSGKSCGSEMLLPGTCALGMDEALTPPSFSAVFSLLPNDWMSSPSLCRTGKQFIYLIPDESDVSPFFLSVELKSPAPCAHVIPTAKNSPLDPPHPAKHGCFVQRGSAKSLFGKLLLFACGVNLLFHSLFTLTCICACESSSRFPPRRKGSE